MERNPATAAADLNRVARTGWDLSFVNPDRFPGFREDSSTMAVLACDTGKSP